MIRKLEDGNGISFKILLNGKQEEFVLALLFKQDYFSEKYNRYEYGFVNSDKTLYISTLYSGGNTGFGYHLNEIKSFNVLSPEGEQKIKFITSDLDEMNRIAEEENIKEKEEYQKNIENIDN